MLCYIILNFNDYRTTKDCVDSIRDFASIDHIVVVDNCSTDDSYEKLAILADEKIDVIRTDHNGGYGSGNNFGVIYSKNTYNPDTVVISNPDVIIEEKTIIECLKFLHAKEDASIVVPLMLDKSEKPFYECVWKIPSYHQYLLFSLAVCGKLIKGYNYSIDLFNTKEYFRCECVAGSWLMLKTDDFIKSGMFDENIFLFCEETVLGIRMKQKNMNCYIIPKIRFIHNHSISVNKSINKYKQQKLMWKSRKYVLDHYYRNGFFFGVLTYAIRNIGLAEYKLRDIYHALFRQDES